MEFLETVEVSIISAIFASFLTYYFGFRQYLKQRKREEFRDEYIKNGIDNIIKDIDESCFICQFNHAKGIRIFEYLEKSLGDIVIEEKITQKIFEEMKPLFIAPNRTIYKLEVLTKKDEILRAFVWIISVMADYLRYNDYLRYELFFELEYYFRHPGTLSKDKREEFLVGLKKRVIESYKKVISDNEMLKVYLLQIRKRIDEIDITDINKINKISKDKKIREVLENIQKDYEKKENTK